MDVKRIYKIWNIDRNIKKGVVISSWQELNEKALSLLDCTANENIRFVLNEDGTEVDEEYLQFVENNSILIALKDGQKWHSPDHERTISSISSSLSSDSQPSSDVIDYGDRNSNGSLDILLNRLGNDISKIITLSHSDLEMIAQAELSDISKLFTEESEATEFQQACQNHLDARFQHMEALELLKFYKRNIGSDDYSLKDNVDDKT